MNAKPSLLGRLLRVSDGDMPPDYARRILGMGFTDADQTRHTELAEKSQAGMLTREEAMELDELLAANDLLTILHAKAHLSLKQTPAA